MNIYEKIVKMLASLGKDVINNLGETFCKNYDQCQYISYENMLNVINSIKKYLPSLFAEENENYFKIFGQTYFKAEMQQWSNGSIFINDEFYNKDNFVTVNCRYTECPNDCENCNTFCEKVPIFFIDVFYDFCLNSEIVKNSLEMEKNKMENTEVPSKPYDLKTIAKNLVINSDEYKKIIDNLYDVGLEEEKIFDIFYEILKNIK